MKSVIRVARSKGRVQRPARSSSRLSATSDRDSRIESMYHSGLTLEEIGKVYGITRERVRQILELRGVDRRTAQEVAYSARERFINEFGADVDALFESTRSIPEVEKYFAAKNIPSVWIRDYLADRRHETVYRTTSSKRWSEAELLKLLQKAANGRSSLSAKQYEAWRAKEIERGGDAPTHTAIGWRFESWRNALEKAGLSTSEPKREYKRKWTADEALEIVATYVRECVEAGQRPVFARYDKWAQQDKSARPCGAYVRYLTGMTWSQAIEQVYQRGLASKDTK